MSDFNNQYKKIMEELSEKMNDPKDLELVKEKFLEMSLMFMDMLDKVSSLSQEKVLDIEDKQNVIFSKMNMIESMLSKIENDIYEDEDDDCCGFEIICPYCNNEFSANSIDMSSDIKCPNCHNMIELDWNLDEIEEQIESFGGCSGSCCGCQSGCHSQEDDIEEEENND